MWSGPKGGDGVGGPKGGAAAALEGGTHGEQRWGERGRGEVDGAGARGGTAGEVEDGSSRIGRRVEATNGGEGSLATAPEGLLRRMAAPSAPSSCPATNPLQLMLPL